MKRFLDLYKKMVSLMTNRQKTLSVLLLFCTVIGAFFECVGVSAIIPLISVIQNKEIIYSEKILSRFPFLQNLSYNQIILGLCAVVVLIYVIKNLFFVFLSWMQIKFACKLQRELSVTLVKSYMKCGYSFFLKHNIGFLGRGITADILNFYNITSLAFTLFSDFIVCLLICILLVFTDWQMSCAVALSGAFCVTLMFFVFRKNMKKISFALLSIQDRIGLVQSQVVYGVKDIMVLRKQKNFIKEFEDLRLEEQPNLIKQGVGSNSPSRIIEAIFVSVILFTIGVKSIVVDDMSSFIAKLAAFALGSFRILPAVGRISSNINNVISRLPSIDSIYKIVSDSKAYIAEHQETDFERTQEVVVEGESFKDELSLENISFRYNKDSDFVFKDLNLKIKKGSSIAFIGQSGAGKSTLVDILLGLLVPEQGSVCLDGTDITQIPDTWAKTVGYIPQTVFLTDSSIKSNIAFGVNENEIDEERIREVIKKAELDDFVKSLPEGINTFVGDRGVRLSGGQRQRIAIARALYHNPKIMVLDEATSALDTETESAIMSAINSLQGQVTLIIVAHRLSTVQNCDVIYEVINKKLIEKSKKDIKING